MKKQLSILLIIFLSINLFSQTTKVEFEDDIDEVYTRMELRGINTSSELLYGYFFYGKNVDNLKSLSNELKKENFKFVRAEPIDDDERIILHIEKVEKMTRDDLRKREKYLREKATVHNVDYDGWDVGNINPELPLTTQEKFVEYLNQLPPQKLFSDAEKFYQLEDYSSSLIGFDISIQREIKLDTSTFYLGCCLARLGDTENGLELLKQVVENYPKYERAAYNVAAISYEIRNFDDTILYYEKVLRLNPKNDEAYYGIAAAEYGKGNYTKTKEYCDKALEINPENKHAKDLLEWLK